MKDIAAHNNLAHETKARKGLPGIKSVAPGDGIGTGKGN
jgi:hypothetical protein